MLWFIWTMLWFIGNMFGDEILITLARKDGAILYGNILRLETDFVNCS